MRIRSFLATIPALLVASPALAAGPAVSEVTSFGTNPAGLQMFEHVPAALPANAPAVLVLHGCTAGGAADVEDVGWNELADANDFLVVYPQQTTSNNPLRCFNWAGVYGDPSNLQRGKGENESIKEMVDAAKSAHGVDPKRVFIVGFSAGGATAAIMAAAWPEIFAGAATMAGIPYDCTTSYSEISTCMKPGKDQTPGQWGDLVRQADPGYAGPWPRFSIWQGSADSIVSPTNRTQMIRQWTNVLGASDAPSATDTVDGQSHAIYKDSKGIVVVESYEVSGMDHGVPVAPSVGCGAAAQYAIDKGICAAAHIADFFGLAKPLSAGDGGVDAGDAGAPSSSSSSSTSSASSTTGGAAPAVDGGGSAPGDAPTDASYGATCSSSPGPASPIAALLLGVALLLYTVRKGCPR